MEHAIKRGRILARSLIAHSGSAARGPGWSVSRIRLDLRAGAIHLGQAAAEVSRDLRTSTIPSEASTLTSAKRKTLA